METIISNIVYAVLNHYGITGSTYFLLGVALLWAILSEIQPFIKDPRFGWLAKYDGPIQTVLGVLGIWKKKSYSVMVQNQELAKKVQDAGINLSTADEAMGKKESE